LGHKVHPTGFRLGVIKDWQSKWYSEAHYAEYIQEDNKIREHIKAKYAEAAISLVEIDRQGKDVTITLHTARPGIVIGRGGQRVDEMRQHLEALVGKKVRLNIQEIRQPELDAYLVARSVAEQIERRVAYRRAMKQSIFRSLQSGAKGIKISAAGRLAGAEIARRATLHEGQVPLHTLRADVDYGFTEAVTTMGRIGVKVWIYKGQVLPELKVTEEEKAAATAATAATVATEAAEAATTEAKVAPAAEVKPARAPKAPVMDNKAAKAPKAAPVPTTSIVGEKLAEATAKANKAKAAAAAADEEKAAKPKAKKASDKSAAAKPPVEKEPEAKVEAKPAPAATKPKAPAAKKTVEKATTAAPAAEEAETPKKKAKKAEAAPEAAPKAVKKASTKNKEEGKDATA
jgi:small subunit ribosomal protein S3